MRSLGIPLVALLVAAMACRGKPKSQEAPAKVEVAGSAAVTGSNNPSSKTLDLPHGPGAPPVKTTAAMTTATMKKLQDLTYPGFIKELHGFSPRWMEVRQRTEDSPKVLSTISLQPCEPTATTIWKCLPMDASKWQDRKAELEEIVAPELQKLPDTVFEIGQTELHGVPMIFTYQLGYLRGADESHYTHAYALYYNDGQNAVRVVSQYADDLTRTREDMVNLVPRADLEKFAKAFMDVYTQAWAN